MLNLLIQYLLKSKLSLFTVLVLGGLSAVGELLVIFLVYILVSYQTGEVLVPSVLGFDIEGGGVLFFIALIIAAVNAIVQIAYNYFALRISYFAEPYFISNLVNKFYGLSRQDQKELGSYDLKVSINKRVEIVVANIVFPLSMIFKTILQLMAVFFSAVWIGGANVLISIALVICFYAVLLKFIKRFMVTFSRKLDTAIYNVLELSEDFVDCTNYIHAAKNHNLVIQSIENQTRIKASAFTQIRFFGLLPRYLLEGIIMVGAFGALFFIQSNDKLTLLEVLPLLAAVSLSALKFVSALQVLYQNYTNFIGSLAQWDEIDMLMRKPIENSPSELHDDYNSIYMNGHLQLSKSNPDLKLKIQNLHLTRGHMYCLLGDSGTGKTSFLRSFVEDVNFKGDFIVDGKKHDSRTLSANTEYISATERLNRLPFSSSFGELTSDLHSVAHKWGLSEIISRIEMSDDYRFEKYISSGQMQRLILLRSLALRKKVLLVDEATNAIDVEKEHVVLQDVKAYAADKVVIVITHRSENLDLFDGIITAEDGHVTVKKFKGEVDFHL